MSYHDPFEMLMDDLHGSQKTEDKKEERAIVPPLSPLFGLVSEDLIAMANEFNPARFICGEKDITDITVNVLPMLYYDILALDPKIHWLVAETEAALTLNELVVKGIGSKVTHDENTIDRVLPGEQPDYIFIKKVEDNDLESYDFEWNQCITTIKERQHLIQHIQPNTSVHRLVMLATDPNVTERHLNIRGARIAAHVLLKIEDVVDEREEQAAKRKAPKDIKVRPQRKQREFQRPETAFGKETSGKVDWDKQSKDFGMKPKASKSEKQGKQNKRNK